MSHRGFLSYSPWRLPAPGSGDSPSLVLLSLPRPSPQSQNGVGRPSSIGNGPGRGCVLRCCGICDCRSFLGCLQPITQTCWLIQKGLLSHTKGSRIPTQGVRGPHPCGSLLASPALVALLQPASASPHSRLPLPNPATLTFLSA